MKCRACSNGKMMDIVHILKRAVLHPSVLHDTNAHTVDPSSGCVLSGCPLVIRNVLDHEVLRPEMLN